MSDWGNFKDRKGKQNKKKEAGSISEPIDLEAGEHVREPEAADVAKAGYGVPDMSVPPPIEDVSKGENAAKATETVNVEASKGNIVGEEPALAAIVEVPKTTKALIPPPPKTKTKTKPTGAKGTAEAIQDAARP
jgi:hypothetical protein